ncbi:hypothetical protein [Phyllobacterium chamaecytisi]|uniref:hypothetical protein n=1 Tax=Phyllobacterium chamaecytisi TaxID=2876082 RepID=UPI001CCE2CB7|nr:hypothetical protein [Phyllobacterium sp. KW56]MBZ9605031.1 hypothetical protein [Phyllobacterium sp. KW56]
MSNKPTALTEPEPVIWEPGDIDYDSDSYHNSKLARFLIVIAIAVAGYLAYQPIKWLLVDWDGIAIPGVKKVADIEIGIRGTLLRDSSLRLVCGADRTLRLVDFTQIPIPKDFRPRDPDPSTGTFSVYRRGESSLVKIEFPKTVWFPHDQIDVVVTHPMLPDQMEEVAQAFDRPPPFNVAFHIAETGATFVPTADGSAIRSLITKCLLKS